MHYTNNMVLKNMRQPISFQNYFKIKIIIVSSEILLIKLKMNSVNIHPIKKIHLYLMEIINKIAPNTLNIIPLMSKIT